MFFSCRQSNVVLFYITMLRYNFISVEDMIEYYYYQIEWSQKFK
jgi:hypothetical protein